MHSKTVGYSGTDRTAQLFSKYLNKEEFDVYLVYRKGDSSNERLDIAREWLGDDKVIGYEWTPGENVSPYIPAHETLSSILRTIEPDIIHVHRSGYTEWPFKSIYPQAKWIETNIFGYADKDPTNRPDMSLYISNYIRNLALDNGGIDGPVVLNPVEQPYFDVNTYNAIGCKNALLEKYNIKSKNQQPILLGRVGRADNFDPISLMAFKEIEKMYNNVYYIVINPCDRWREMAEQLEIKNIRFGEKIIDDKELSQFYMGIDIYAHARHDGECCPCNIQEAMMHGNPIVSHESLIHNGQREIIEGGGFLVPVGDWQSYRDVLISLIENNEIIDEESDQPVNIRDNFGLDARRRAMRFFEAETVTRQLEQVYKYLLK